MKNDTLEHLSSLMDGELSQETGLFVARRMSADSELGQTWERYHLIRECLRRPGGKWSALSLSVDVEAVQPVAIEPPRRWLKPLSGLAIAASVAKKSASPDQRRSPRSAWRSEKRDTSLLDSSETEKSYGSRCPGVRIGLWR